MPQYEVEIEWRRRLTLLEAQRLLLNFFRGQPVVHVEDYRIRNYGELQRRLGERRRYSGGTFNFRSFADYMRLVDGPLGSFSSSASTRTATTAATTAAATAAAAAAVDTTELISFVKMTTCFHHYYYYDETEDLERNNRYPRIFCCKRSIEVNEEEEEEEEENRDGKYGEEEAEVTADQALDQIEQFEMDRSDNNLGLKFVHKVYVFTPDFVRVCLYAVLDEFGSVRYEIGIEKELHSVAVCPLNVGAVYEAMQQCSSQLHRLTHFFHYVECPAINLTTGWIHDNSSNTTLMSLCCEPSATKHSKLYEIFLNNLLENCCQQDRLRCDTSNNRCGGGGSNSSPEFLIKLKIDGIKCFAVFDGSTSLCLDNGSSLDLRELFPVYREQQQQQQQPPNFHRFFSTHLVYQLERVQLPCSDETTDRATSSNCYHRYQYFITDVMAVRNQYATVIQAPLHTFASTVQRYKKQAGQEWPFYLVGTDLSHQPKLVEALTNARQNRCPGGMKCISSRVNRRGAAAAAAATAVAAAAAAAATENHGFVTITVNESRLLLERLQAALVSVGARHLHVNTYQRPHNVRRWLCDEPHSFGRYQFLLTYKHLIELFAEHELDRDVMLELLTKCQSNMLGSDFDELKRQLHNNTTTTPRSSALNTVLARSTDLWTASDNLPACDLFRLVDGLIVYRRFRTASLQNNQNRSSKCSYRQLISANLYNAYKIKTFQTIELMYTEERGEGEGGGDDDNGSDSNNSSSSSSRLTRWFKTDDFYRKFYFVQKSSNRDGSSSSSRVWYRFDMVPVQLRIPQRYLPLVNSSTYEILCENETSFYLIRRRRDKCIPDSTFKVNAIVFARQPLQFRPWPGKKNAARANATTTSGGAVSTAAVAIKRRRGDGATSKHKDRRRSTLIVVNACPGSPAVIQQQKEADDEAAEPEEEDEEEQAAAASNEYGHNDDDDDDDEDDCGDDDNDNNEAQNDDEENASDNYGEEDEDDDDDDDYNDDEDDYNDDEDEEAATDDNDDSADSPANKEDYDYEDEIQFNFEELSM